jgi:hypothetical protein
MYRRDPKGSEQPARFERNRGESEKRLQPFAEPRLVVLLDFLGANPREPL